MTRDELTDAIKELQEELKKTNTQLDSTTTIANTANTTVNGLNNNFLNKTYPVGSVYVSNKNVNPGTIFGGTRVAFGSGRTLVGVSSSDTNYNTVEKTGGSNSQNITLTTSNLPSHTHTVTAKGTVSSTFTGSSATTSSVGKSTAFSVSHIQPYITVYMWKRTA